MSRLEKKCFLASVGAHAALALLLFAGSWIWVAQQPELARPVLNMIPSALLDGVKAGGGSPTAKAMPAPAPATQRPLVVPAPAPPTPEPAPAKAEAKPAKQEQTPPKTHSRRTIDPVVPNKKTTKADESDDSGESKPAKKRIEISLVRETGTARQKSSAADGHGQAESNARVRAQYTDRLNHVLGAIGQGLSSGGVSFEVPGPGGEAYADYGQWVVTAYYRAWSPPSDLANDLATVTAEVVILRSGTVESFTIIKRSGHATLDKTVQRLRNDVTFIAMFPKDAQDDKRTFIIDFNLRSKR
jgi:TonB family protein